jgi:hypothetical protein
MRRIRQNEVFEVIIKIKNGKWIKDYFWPFMRIKTTFNKNFVHEKKSTSSQQLNNRRS